MALLGWRLGPSLAGARILTLILGILMRKLGIAGAIGLFVFSLAVGDARSAAAINIRIDYSRDTNDFFGAGNPQGAAAGAQAKAALEAAAAFYSNHLEDTFSSISAPATFNGAQGGQAKFFWKRKFIDPATGANHAEVNTQVSANEYVIYVGARDLPESQLGNGGAGGYVGGFAARSGNLTSAENAEINTKVAQFLSESTKRGETSGFGRWGGSLAFDRPTIWHFNHTTNPGGGTQDFYSVALHELAHALGFGAADEWEALVSGSGFTGANSLSIHTPSGNVPLASTDDTGHWQQAIAASPIYGGSGNQTPLMVPTIVPGVRRLLTNLDAAGLADIGWEIALPGTSASAATSLVSFHQNSGSASFAALSASVVPEPGSAVLALVATGALSMRRKRQR